MALKSDLPGTEVRSEHITANKWQSRENRNSRNDPTGSPIFSQILSLIYFKIGIKLAFRSLRVLVPKFTTFSVEI